MVVFSLSSSKQKKKNCVVVVLVVCVLRGVAAFRGVGPQRLVVWGRGGARRNELRRFVPRVEEAVRPTRTRRSVSTKKEEPVVDLALAEEDDASQTKRTKKSVQTLLAQFVALSAPYFKETKEARVCLAKVVGLTLLQSGVSVVFSYLSRDFYNALSAKDVAAFQSILIKFAAALSAGVPITVLYRFERERLSLRWRRWMTIDVLAKYTSNRKYYELEAAVVSSSTSSNATKTKERIDNPDQRIAEDVGAFTAVSLSFGITALTSIIDLVSFSSILYSIYAPLFVAIVAYASLGSFLTAFVGKDLAFQNFDALRREADFRYALVRLRENAEAVAFYRGEPHERDEANLRLEKAVDSQFTVLKTQRSVEFVTVAYRFLVQILPIAVVAPLYFQGSIELGSVTQASSAFNHVLADLSAIVNQFESIAAFGAGLDRLASFTDRLDDVEDDVVVVNATTSPVQDDAVSVLKATDVEVRTPDGKRSLVSGLNLDVRPGDSLVVVGASGAGKSSVLRALASLWRPARGTVVLDEATTSFLPQRPYCTLGTLRDQLVYPKTWADWKQINAASTNESGDDDDEDAGETKDAEVRAALRDVGLARLVDRLDVAADWSNTLSLGEQQRLAFARLLLARPKLVVCDEATSALDVDSERHLYKLLKLRLGQDLALLSVGHRPSLLEHHDFRLRIANNNNLDDFDDFEQSGDAASEKSEMKPPVLERVSAEDRAAAARVVAL